MARFPPLGGAPSPVDLRDDWLAALTAAGFDRTQPTAWLAEGLLSYLPSDAQDRLFEMFTALSSPDSQVAVEVFGTNSNGNTRRLLRMRERLGLDVNIQTLTYHEPDRWDPAQWLADHGWQVHGVNNHDEMARLGPRYPKTWPTRPSAARCCERVSANHLTEQQRNRQRAGALDEHKAHP